MKSLSNVKSSMTYVLTSNHETFDTCTSVQHLHDTIKNILLNNGIDTPASRRLLLNIKKNRYFNDALQTVYNSIMYGSGGGVI